MIDRSTDPRRVGKKVTIVMQCNQVQSGGTYFRKYRNVWFDGARWQRFLKFCRSIDGGVHHINVYDPNRKKGSNFITQIRDLT